MVVLIALRAWIVKKNKTKQNKTKQNKKIRTKFLKNWQINEGKKINNVMIYKSESAVAILKVENNQKFTSD